MTRKNANAEDFDALGVETVLVNNLGSAGATEPRPIQAAAIPPALDGKDVIGIAQTGRGKTFAYLVPMIQRIVEEAQIPKGRLHGRKPKKPLAKGAARLRGLVLVPTRELAFQVAQEAELLTKRLRFTVAVAVGKSPIGPQTKAISDGAELLVATPGRVRELGEKGIFDWCNLSVAAIDEADRMMDMGFLPQIESLLSELPAGRQHLLFSATMPKQVERLSARFLTDPVRLEVDPEGSTAANLKHRPIAVPGLRKIPLLLEKILPSRRGVLVFCRTRRRVDFVAKALREAGIACDSIHGDRSQSARRQALSDFTEGHVEVLISTDVAARGLHIERVKTVVHYDIPLEPDGYVHRSGRAGHGGGRGTAVALVMPTERNLWRKLAKACDISEPLEAVEGYEPHAKKPSGTRPPKSRRVRHETVRRKGRSRASKPIAKGEKPGSGVKRRPSS